MTNDLQQNDIAWQRHIDRLMKKLEEPSCSIKSPLQIEETQFDDQDGEEIENHPPIIISQTGKLQQQQQTFVLPAPPPPVPFSSAAPLPITENSFVQTQKVIPIFKRPTQIHRTEEIGVQTDFNEKISSIHSCCQDVSTCPCVLRYSKLERLFMEKMSHFISLVPNVPQSPSIVQTSELSSRPRRLQSNSRCRRIRPPRRRFVFQRPNATTTTTTTTVAVGPSQPTEEMRNKNRNEDEDEHEEQEEEEEEGKDKEKEEEEEAHKENSQSIVNETFVHQQNDDFISTTITKGPSDETIAELSTIERMETTDEMDHPSTLLISTANETTHHDLSARPIVLTASSLEDLQKNQFRQFVSQFGVSTSQTVDGTTTHIIVNDNPPLICPLTGKIIQGIARHLFIVSYRWLNECLKEKSFVDERPFEIRGDTSLGADHGGMRRSRLTPSYLFENFAICLRCTSNDCAPLQSVEQVQELINICGGKLLSHFSQIQSIDQQRQIVLVLGLNGFTGNERKRQALLDTCQQYNVKCVNIHWLLISIAKFEIQPFDTYDINQN